jgi:hypothetical protein
MTPEHWQALRHEGRQLPQGKFATTLTRLLESDGTATIEPPPSALGNYVLLHGLLQRVFLLRQASLPGRGKSALPDKDIECLEYVG